MPLIDRLLRWTTLPTGRRARFSSGLSVLDFMKRTSFIAASDAALAAVGPAAIALAATLASACSMMGETPAATAPAAETPAYSQTCVNSRHSPLLMPLLSWSTASPANRRFSTAMALADSVTPPIR